jgi:hypothetical protein
MTEQSRPFEVSGGRLETLAAGLWHVGSGVLFVKAATLLVEAHVIEPGSSWPWLAIAAGAALGVVKAKYLFTPSCQRNLDRIRALERPRIWQFFRPAFLVFLALMILAGAGLSRLAHNHFAMLVALVLLDTSIATALLVSGRCFRQRGAVK